VLNLVKEGLCPYGRGDLSRIFKIDSSAAKRRLGLALLWIFKTASSAAERQLTLARRFNAGNGHLDPPVAERRLSGQGYERPLLVIFRMFSLFLRTSTQASLRDYGELSLASRR
jgi:hypothetical protein